MLKILWKRGKIAPEEQFLLLSTIFCYQHMLDFYVKTRIRFFLRDEQLFEITEVEITRVDCICKHIAKVRFQNCKHLRQQKHFTLISSDTIGKKNPWNLEIKQNIYSPNGKKDYYISHEHKCNLSQTEFFT